MRPALRHPLFTIGHSNHSIERFLELLRRHGVEAVADVRSRPYSRFVPHFGKARLARVLADAGFDYLFLGQELGGKPVRGASPHAPSITRRAFANRRSSEASRPCSMPSPRGRWRSSAASATRSIATGCI